MLISAGQLTERTGPGGSRGPNVLQRLLTPSLSSAAVDPRLYRSFVILHLIGPFFGLPVCAVLLLLDENAGAVPLLFTASVATFWLMPFLARRGLAGAAFLSVQLLTSVSLFGAFFYGGLNSPFSVWLIVAVLLGFLYLPGKMAWCAALITLQCGLFLLAIEAFAPPPRLHEAELGLLFLASSTTAAFYVSLVASFYSRIKSEGSELRKIAGRYDDTAGQLVGTIAWLEADNERAAKVMAQASHDLRTALDVVIGYSDLLIEDAQAEEREVDQRRLARITASSRQMLALLADGERLSEAAPDDAATLGDADEPRLSDGPKSPSRGLFALRPADWLRPTISSLGALAMLGAAGSGLLALVVSGSPLQGLVAASLVLGGSVLARTPARTAPESDTLTGLPNRDAFKRELEERILSSLDMEVALLFADLDGFKEVNDSLGHDVGDQLLAKVAERFVAVRPPGAILARLGGDEFAAAMFGPGAEAALRRFAGTMLDTLLDPIRTDEHHLTIGVSIGLSCGNAGQISARELLRRSDVAMYRAKHDKRTAVQVFDVQMDEALNFRRTMRDDLAQALSGDELELHLQPVVDARSGELASVEALLRWTHPVLGPVSPAKLVALAEESGQIVAIDNWVLERALEHAKRLRTVPVAINISPVQFRHPSFARKIVDRLEAHGIPPQLLRLEITEGVLVTHTRAADRAITQLREAGVKVALDDFGTGFSSLSYLKDFGFDLLKIDRSFIKALDKGRQGAELLRAIVDLGHSLSMSVVAEGVETAKQAALVQLLGCDFIQGYHTGKPMPLDQLEAWMDEASPVADEPLRPRATG